MMMSQPMRASGSLRGTRPKSDPNQCDDDAHDVAPEEHDDRRLGAELRDRGERGARVLRAGQELAEDAQVGARGDREELGQSLDEAEDERFEHVGSAFRLRGSRRDRDRSVSRAEQVP